MSKLCLARQKRSSTPLCLGSGRPLPVQHGSLHGHFDCTLHDLCRQQHQQRSEVLFPHNGRVVGREGFFLFFYQVATVLRLREVPCRTSCRQPSLVVGVHEAFAKVLQRHKCLSIALSGAPGHSERHRKVLGGQV